MWDATRRCIASPTGRPVSIHAPRVGCDKNSVSYSKVIGVSIHAPRVGCDQRLDVEEQYQDGFQSTHPVWDATHKLNSPGVGIIVSIHAPRVGCDAGGGQGRAECPGFNPRTPCGMRPSTVLSMGGSYMFQSTHPVWDATDCPTWRSITPSVSIHAPRVGCDAAYGRLFLFLLQFQSTHPVWDATSVGGCRFHEYKVSIHAPRVGCDNRHYHAR